jgi:hypothetical protein
MSATIVKFPGYLRIGNYKPRPGGGPVQHAGKRYETLTEMRRDLSPLDHSRCFKWAFRDFNLADALASLPGNNGGRHGECGGGNAA